MCDRSRPNAIFDAISMPVSFLLLLILNASVCSFLCLFCMDAVLSLICRSQLEKTLRF